MPPLGIFTVIDGMDGSGKSTQLRLLQEKLQGHNVLFTREPGGSPRAEEIRHMVLQSDGTQSNAVCDFFLFLAARGSHVEDIVNPARVQGTHVFCDRYDSSTYAFQIYGEQSPSWIIEMFRHVRKGLPKKYLPSSYIILDLPAEVAFERRQRDQEQEKSKFDLRPLDFHQRVRDGFKQFAAEFGSTDFVDANRTPEEIHVDIWALVQKQLSLH
jgi:dTMP kinase